MRTLILSDIHANLMALEAVLVAAAGQWDRLWFLGDLVGYGPNPNECIALLREHEQLALAGNHDWAVLGKFDPAEFNQEAKDVVNWTRQVLTEDNRGFLEELPPKVIQGSFTLAHASPRNPVWEYILDLQTAMENFEYFATPYCLVGHSHVPALFALDQAAAKLDGFVVDEGEVVPLGQKRLILNPGSVGQPRDGDPRAAYAIIDDETMTCTFHRAVYDIAETQRRMRALDFPERLISRLANGV